MLNMTQCTTQIFYNFFHKNGRYIWGENISKEPAVCSIP